MNIRIPRPHPSAPRTNLDPWRTRELLECLVGRVRIRLEFKPADLWVGVFVNVMPSSLVDERWCHVWVCVIPCVPIHVDWHRWGESGVMPF